MILVIIDYLTKIIYYKLVKVMINRKDLAKDIFNIVVRYYSISNTIGSNWNFVFISKF